MQKQITVKSKAVINLLTKERSIMSNENLPTKILDFINHYNPDRLEFLNKLLSDNSMISREHSINKQLDLCDASDEAWKNLLNKLMSDCNKGLDSANLFLHEVLVLYHKEMREKLLVWIDNKKPQTFEDILRESDKQCRLCVCW